MLTYDGEMNCLAFRQTGLLLVAASFNSPCSADDFRQVAIVEDERINESSGLAVSYNHPKAVWIHNDSGDKSRLYLVGLDGTTQAVVKVLGAKSFDWEDMCSFRIDGQSWLLIGDIGDNEKKRGRKKHPECRLYLLKEPRIPRSNGLPTIDWEITARIDFDYEDGPWDCEGLAVDAEQNEILLLTKSVPQKSGLYSMPLDLKTPKQQLTARRIATPYIPFATALDISPSGRTMVVGSLLNGLVIHREQKQTWGETFAKQGRAITLPPRKQGETICFDHTGEWLYLNSEKPKQPLWRMKIPSR